MSPPASNAAHFSSFTATPNNRLHPQAHSQPIRETTHVRQNANLNVDSELTLTTATQSNDSRQEANMGISHQEISNQTHPEHEPNNSATSKKATRHRKRVVPPGPAGVWYQAQRHSKHKKGSRNSRVDSLQRQQDQDSSKRDDDTPIEDISSCPAWMCMQRKLGFCTPFLPSYFGSKERYERLRKYVPPEYALLREIHQGLHDLRLTDKSLLVLIHSVQYHGHVDWTVELRDESGDRIQAWLEPKLVEKELNESRYVRLGVVWCLKDVSMAVSVDDFAPIGSTSVERMLLVSESNIQEMWTPQEGAEEITDPIYLEWVEKRTSFPNENCNDFGEDLGMTHAGNQTDRPFVGSRRQADFSLRQNLPSSRHNSNNGTGGVIRHHTVQDTAPSLSQSPSAGPGSTTFPQSHDRGEHIQDETGMQSSISITSRDIRAGESVPYRLHDTPMEAVNYTDAENTESATEPPKQAIPPREGQNEMLSNSSNSPTHTDAPKEGNHCNSTRAKPRQSNSSRSPLKHIYSKPQSRQQETDDRTQYKENHMEGSLSARPSNSEGTENSKSNTRDAASKLWVMPDDSMISLLDEDEDAPDSSKPELVEPAPSCNHHEENDPSTNDTSRKENQQERAPASTLFEVGTFDGVDVDELFDDDDDD